MQVNPYLLFGGQCEAAFRYYEKVLGGKITAMMPHEGTPAESQVPAEWRKKIIHARLAIGDETLMGSDAPPDRYKPPQGFSVSVQVKTLEDAERIFHALADNGKVTMPLTKTFFSPAFGMLTDQFGIPWMVNCDQAS
jgi:PhnB protein